MTRLAVEDVEKQFAAAMAEQGFGEHFIPADEEWHHFAFPDSRNAKTNGAAKLTFGERPEGVVIDRRKDTKPIFTWRPHNGATIHRTDAERQAAAVATGRKAAEKKALQEKSRAKALHDFISAPKASADHPYLKKKGIKNPRPLRADGDKLMVPIYGSGTSEFQTVQRISPNGDKIYPKDAVKAGGCAMPGSRELDDLKKVNKQTPIVIAEGYANAAAVRGATHYPTLAAMDWVNLMAVAKAMRERFPLNLIIMAADNDEGKPGNRGVTEAEKAARAVGAKIAIPPPGDFAELLVKEGEGAVEKVIKNAVEPDPATQADADTRPVITIKAGEHSAVADRAEKTLLTAGVPFFQRSNSLVRPIIETVDAAHGRKTKVAQLVRIDATYLRDMLGRVASWRKFNWKKQEMQIDPPVEIGATILSRVGEWTFPAIAGVISTPTMRPDGSLLTEPGFDPVTRLLLVEPPSMPAIPDAPTRKDALAALALLEELLIEFPFKDEVARSVALSAIITPVVRGAFPVAPMHSASAPTAGSGKSYLFDNASAIAIGQIMPVMAAGRNEEETEKRLGAALLSGQPLISIDNVNGQLKGDALCQMIERPVVEVRILGKSERVRIEARGTTIYCTGNNIVVVGDLCRRTITVALDPKMERPELRDFKANPVEKILADRGSYIAAALIVCRAYVVAGQPKKAQRLASFEGWSDTVRSALIWLEKADPVHQWNWRERKTRNVPRCARH